MIASLNLNPIILKYVRILVLNLVTMILLGLEG